MIGGSAHHVAANEVIVWCEKMAKYLVFHRGVPPQWMTPGAVQRWLDAVGSEDWDLSVAVFHKDELPATAESIAEDLMKTALRDQLDLLGRLRQGKTPHTFELEAATQSIEAALNGIAEPIAAESIAEEAQRLVNGPRQADYGDPKENFERWQAICKTAFGIDVSTKELVNIMKAGKLARNLQRPKRDNNVDYIGYSLLDERLHPGDFS
jgi:hypothetical protein